MFNFLVTSRPGAWDIGFYEWDESRILEFTESAVPDEFEKFTDAELLVMQKYPCLFAYEGSAGGMRVGRIRYEGNATSSEYLIIAV